KQAKPANADRKIGGRRLFGQARRKVAESRLPAGSANNNSCGAADDGGSGEDGVRRSGGVIRAQRRIAGLLLGGVRLSGQQRLVDEEVAAFEQSRVRRYEIAGY